MKIENYRQGVEFSRNPKNIELAHNIQSIIQ